MLLLVEDTASVSSIAAMLEGADCDLVVVTSGAEALRVLGEREVAVCVVALDDTLGATAQISADARARNVPIVVVTNAEIESAPEVVDVIRRPIEVSILRAKLSVFEAVQRHRVRAVGRLQAELLATLGQELRPPLHAIVGWVRMLRDGSLREPQRARALETVERSAQAQLELIEEMLDVSRMTSHALALELVVVDVRRVVDDVVEELRPSAVDKQLTLFAAIDDDVAPMYADAARMRQIVHRLVKNAVSSTPTEGVVTVSLRNADSNVELAITDTGASNDVGAAPRVFDGFAIVRHLVELHDGTLAIEDQTSGVGRQFVVTLPAAGRPPRTDDEVR